MKHFVVVMSTTIIALTEEDAKKLALSALPVFDRVLGEDRLGCEASDVDEVYEAEEILPGDSELPEE